MIRPQVRRLGTGSTRSQRFGPWPCILDVGLGLRADAETIEADILAVIGADVRTYDVAGPDGRVVGTEAMGDAIAAEAGRLLSALRKRPGQTGSKPGR
jgi:hypothetical protein